jgi:hypothetical protein
MTPPSEVVFLFDVDNTMLDNDRVQDDLRNHLEHVAPVGGPTVILCDGDTWSSSRAKFTAQGYGKRSGAVC